MTRFFYDGTFEGLLTTVFEIYERKITAYAIERGAFEPKALFEDAVNVVTDNVKSERVMNGLYRRLSPAAVERLYIAHLAAVESGDVHLIGFIRHAFDTNYNIEEDFSNRHVLKVSETVGKMRRERHRMEAFVRFKKLRDDLFYAGIEPDFNVLPLLIRHFKARYADQKWMIYDLKRRYGIYYDRHDVEFIEVEFANNKPPGAAGDIFTEDEPLYNLLWKNYYQSANIPARKNTRLHLRHIPKRYWKHLTEKF